VLRKVVLAVTDAGVLQGIKCGIPKGWPDITACLPGGRFLGIECKAPKGTQSEEQKMFQALIEGLGGIYILARSVEDVKMELESLGFCLD
jgi:hypothetical protein